MNKATSNYPLNAVLIMLVLIGILLVLQALIRYNDFVGNQQALMQNEVEIGGKEVERLINNLHNEVEIFAEEKYEIINFLAAYPDSEEIGEHIQKKVKGLFPDYMSVSIADDNALPRYNSAEKDSDIVCLDDIIAFLTSGNRSDISIHEHNGKHHFDVMSKWGRTRVRGILKISFKPEIISRSLQISESPGHKLVLLHKNKNDLIEISATGARVHPELKETIRLDEEALSRVGASHDVKGTHWQLVALPEENLYSDQLKFILYQTLTVVLAIAIVSLIMLRTIKRAEIRREKSESELVTAKEHLQQALDFSEVYMCRWNIKTDSLVWSGNAKQFFNNNMPGHFNSYLQLLDKSYRDELRNVIDTCLNTNEPYQHEHIINFPDGRRCWLEMSGNFEVNTQSGHIEMISLVTDISERKQAENKRIEVEKSQRDTLVREVHHRIKNHLQGVVGLLRQHTVKNPEISDVIDMAAGQLHSVSTVYGLQSQKQKANVSVNELMAEICRANEGMLGAEIHFTTSGKGNNEVVLSEERAVAIALIINELMTNAIKHGTSENRGVINVDLQVESSAATITIKNRLDAVPAGFDFESGTGLGTGLTLIRSLLPGKGSHLSIIPGDNFMKAELKLCSPVVRNEV